jgi:hypothetical protein
VVDRQLLTFLVSPRKCKQKKANAFAALRVPIYAAQKMGKFRHSPAAQTANLFNPFSTLHKWQRLKRMKFNNNIDNSRDYHV